MKYISGYPFYGQTLGILVFSTTTPRIRGDAGNATSFAYPVCYEVVKGGFADLIEGSPEIQDNLIQAVRNLRDKGIGAVLGDCGMMSLYQDILGKEGLPVAASSLCQIPLVWQLVGRSGAIGVITGHSGLLSRRHLLASGWNEEITLSIQGMEDEPHFAETVIHGGHHLDPAIMTRDVHSAVQKLMDKTVDLRAVIVECSNLATFSQDIWQLCQRPVFDTISAANLLAYAVCPPRYL